MNVRRLTALLGVLPLLALAANASSKAVLSVTSPADAGPGSLRDMVAMAAPGDVIGFGSPMTITLNSPIVVGVNHLTIEGCYPDVLLSASGLFPGLELQGVTGCQIRGLRMEGFDPALLLRAGAIGNSIGGPNPCDRVEVYNGGHGVVITDLNTVSNVFLNVVSRNNLSEGIYLRSGASYNFFGDGTLAGAVYSFSNTLNGVRLEAMDGIADPVEVNIFQFCLIGTDLSGHAASGNSLSGVVLDGTGVRSNFFSGCILSGNSVNGVSITGGASLNQFEKCHIGTDIDGKVAVGNSIGVDIEAGFQNRIEGLNVISGNRIHGVRIRSSASYQNIVAASALGPDVSFAALGNGGSGIALLDGTFENTVFENHISSNVGNGILLRGNDPHHNLIENNLVGVNKASSAAMPNGLNGILLDSVASDNRFVWNIVSGNTLYGIAVAALGCDRNEFHGNIVGVDLFLASAIPNGSGGVLVAGSANRFGGMSPNEGNVICANTGWGVEVRGPVVGWYASRNEFLGDTIGLPGLGNDLGGVFLDSGAVENFIGGTIPTTGGVPGNNIWNNNGPGVLVQDAATSDPADGNQILTNSISDNAGSGIELAGNGNCMIPAPLIAVANSAGVSGYTTAPGFPCLVQVFRDSNDEGREYLGEAWVSSSYGAFSVAVALSPGDRVTATQTVEYGCTTLQAETSPFSSVMTAVEIGTPGCFCPSTLAPCGNADPNAGCANSTGLGATLKAHGSASVANDDLTFSAEQLPLGTFAMLLGSLAQRNVPFGDGRLCVGGGGVRIWRFQLRNSRQWGATVYGAGLVARSHMFFAIGHINSGDTWYFQTFYRDTFGPCGGGRNLSNNVEITFTP